MDKFIQTEMLGQLAKKDPLSYGIQYIDLLEERKWSVADRLWIPEIYRAVNPFEIQQSPNTMAHKMALIKPTQIGMSTMGITKMFHFADWWKVRIFYTLPRQNDILDFVGTRVDPMISSSERLKGKLGMPDSSRSKRIGDSYIFFMELTVEPRMMPADALFVDEVDLSDQKNVGTAANRLDASAWKLMYFFSTPTIPNYGIHAQYLKTDQRVWLVKCPGCGTHQELLWNNNIRVSGLPSRPDDVQYMCSKCGRTLTMLEIQEQGQWIAEKPSLSKDFVGFRISQLMTHSARLLYGYYIEPDVNIREFYRKRLGIPYEIEGGSLSREDILLNCFGDHVDFERYAKDKDSDYFMGVDQGNELQILVAKVNKEEKRPKIVHAEVVPFEKGFERVYELMRLFRIRKAVIDGDPNRHQAVKVVKAFPGKMLIADYASITTRFRVSQQDPDLKKLGQMSNVSIERTEGIDNIVETIRKGWWLFPGGTDPIAPIVDQMMTHLTNIKRDIEDRKTPSGEKKVGIWRSPGADHFVHAMVYLKTAIDVSYGKSIKIYVPDREGEEETSSGDTIEEYDMPKVEQMEETKKKPKIKRIRLA